MLLRPPQEETANIRIVGQGLAGSALALRLHDLGYKVILYDNGYASSSSKIAAGMWNPLSFVNLKRTWMVDSLLPEMASTYTRFEQLLGCSFYHPKLLLRIFPDAGSANSWEEKSIHPEVASYLESQVPANAETHFFLPHGGGVVKGAGWLDLPAFLEATRSFFLSRQAFHEMEIGAGHVMEWLERGDCVIQCTGWKPMADSLWSEVPIHTNKGQVFTLKVDGLTNDYMSNFGRFMIPLGDGMFRTGSTYEHGALDMLPSHVANEILDDVGNSVRHSFEVVNHKAGFRPTTIDRQPIVGMHDKHMRLGILNGFGSRGVMLVPYFVQHLINHLVSGAPIMKEVDWRRFEERRKRNQ